MSSINGDNLSSNNSTWSAVSDSPQNWCLKIVLWEQSDSSPKEDDLRSKRDDFRPEFAVVRSGSLWNTWTSLFYPYQKEFFSAFPSSCF